MVYGDFLYIHLRGQKNAEIGIFATYCNFGRCASLAQATVVVAIVNSCYIIMTNRSGFFMLSGATARREVNS